MNKAGHSLLLFFILTVAAPAQPPQWALTHKHPRYPIEEFILGVGLGTGEKAMESAIRLAQSDIAAQLRVKVQTEIRNVQQTFELNRNEETFADFKIKSTSVVEEQLTGATIAESVTDSATATAYVLAVLNKESFARSLESGLMTSWNDAAELRASSERFLAKGRLNEALQSLLQVRRMVVEFLPTQALHDAIARGPFIFDRAFGPETIAAEIRFVLSSVHLEKKSGDNQHGRIGEKFPEPFVVHASLERDGERVPLKGTSIAFLNSRNEYLDAAPTDENGNAAFLGWIRGGSFVRAKLWLPQTASEFKSTVESSTIDFSFTPEEPSVAFGVKVNAKPPRIAEALRTVLVRQITAAGYRVVDMSRFVVDVGFHPSPASRLDGIGGSLYTVAAEATISVVDKQSGKILGTMKVGSKGMGATEAEALEKSTRIEPDPREFPLLLEKAIN